ncbi:hypothetical protein [Euzebya tangerina]|uniref:hypothetical protein n=1 Tax=Euzebya tangerina TaxID=591198 RepID=UPI0013C30DE5|nr:hypothetical protein [Euzebya tangerina]
MSSSEPTPEPRPRELIAAARVADGLVVVVGLAGVVAGAQLFRAGDLAFAIIAWILTFIAGAALRLVVWMARGIAAVMDRTERIEQDIVAITRTRRQGAPEEGLGNDPYGRLGGWH